MPGCCSRHFLGWRVLARVSQCLFVNCRSLHSLSFVSPVPNLLTVPAHHVLSLSLRKLGGAHFLSKSPRTGLKMYQPLTKFHLPAETVTRVWLRKGLLLLARVGCHMRTSAPIHPNKCCCLKSKVLSLLWTPHTLKVSLCKTSMISLWPERKKKQKRKVKSRHGKTSELPFPQEKIQKRNEINVTCKSGYGIFSVGNTNTTLEHDWVETYWTNTAWSFTFWTSFWTKNLVKATNSSMKKKATDMTKLLTMWHALWKAYEY